VISKRAQEIEPFIVMEVMERAQELEAKGEHSSTWKLESPIFRRQRVSGRPRSRPWRTV